MHLSLSIKVGSILLLGGVSAGMISSVASVALSSEISEALSVPEDQILLLKSKAKGSQIYVCQPIGKDPREYGKSDPYQWVLKAPEAELFNVQGLQKGKHYLGPTWEWQDGSKVQGKVKTKVDAPDPQAIPWLLLEAKQPAIVASQTGAVSGTLSSVKWVQRLNTVGGKAPQTTCDRTTQNREVRSSYTADYYFYGNRP